MKIKKVERKEKNSMKEQRNQILELKRKEKIRKQGKEEANKKEIQTKVEIERQAKSSKERRK